MKLNKNIPWVLCVSAAAMFTAFSCSSDDDKGGSGAATCDALCKDADFTSGTETDFGGGLVECQCAGSGSGIEQSSCTAYCAQFDVGASDSLLSTETNPNDKCVCDGTG